MEELKKRILEVIVSLEKLRETWDTLDWAEIPDSVTENYPFYKDLDQMTRDAKRWYEEIKDIKKV
ncbi:hypothetical protein [Brevibacillus nitrificans]|uniref:hypothetical protein n=1 Tax=Brevibacillus nitrificans TaxID=651560 RepID=UPI0028560BDB|nr:hypothetical protein [Brevibacillus nitrificans]MDR7316061.1 hypothetical protein [Brevibacillus nitrificans]